MVGGFGKALTWDPSQMITCRPKKIPKFLLKRGVVQFCLILPTQSTEQIFPREVDWNKNGRVDSKRAVCDNT